MRIRKAIIFYIILFLVIGFALETTSYLVGSYLGKTRGVIYIPRVLEGYDDYVSTRDKLLGWPAPETFGQGEYDLSGSRLIPAFPDETEACVSLYGDSFTWSSEVDHDHAWSNVLSTLMNCRVSNYGVVGYGTDQAYLRFKQNTTDEANIVILGYFSAGIYRNVSQYRTLTVGVSQFDLKPRFIVNERGELELIAIPDLSKNEYIEMVEDPARYLKYEYFVPGGPSGLQMFQFPYTWSVLRSFGHERMQANLIGKPWYADFYLPDHPSQALEVTAKIIVQFQREAEVRDKTSLILIIPVRKDLVYYQANRRWVYQNLIDKLNEQGIDVLNIGEGMVNYLGERDACELYSPENCAGHFNQEGYQVLAKLVYNHLRNENLLPAQDSVELKAGSR